MDKFDQRFINLPAVPDDINVQMKKYYGNNISELSIKIQYYQNHIDIDNNILEVGQEIYYVFGTSLKRGIIEEILPFDFETIEPRIKIKGKKKYFDSYSCVLIKQK